MKLSHERFACFTLGVMLAVIATAPAKARILPATYAHRFCELRAIGMDKETARQIAFRDAYISEPDAQVRLSDGTPISAGAYEAVSIVATRCPQYLK